jgi:hypothetical protein
MEVKGEDNKVWRFTRIYDKPRAEHKHVTWTLLKDLFVGHEQNPMPPLCAGDFNEILYHHEKEGGVPRSQACLDRFKEVLEDCHLHDLGFVGNVFAWRNKQYREANYIHERLDRVVANAAWRDLYPLVHVKNGDHFHSDHRPVIILTEGVRHRSNGDRRGSTFKFEASWLWGDLCGSIVSDAWAEGGVLGGGFSGGEAKKCCL